MIDFIATYPPRELCRDVGAFLFTVVFVICGSLLVVGGFSGSPV